MKAKKWVLVKQFSGIPTEENLKLIEFDSPDELQENGINARRYIYLLVRRLLLYNNIYG